MCITILFIILWLCAMIGGILSLIKGFESAPSDIKVDTTIWEKDHYTLKIYGGILITIGCIGLSITLYHHFFNHIKVVSIEQKSNFGFKFY